MKTIIMAGGKGTRIASLNSNVPKPMIDLAGKPVLEHTIECLRSQGFDEIIMTVSYMADVIMNHFGNGGNFGVKIEYYVEEKPLGNAGALFRIRDKLGDRFLLLNADVIFDVDLNRFAQYHSDKNALVTLFTHPNSHPYDSGIIIADENHSVTQWLTKEDVRPQWYRNRVNAGIHIIESSVLDDVEVSGEKIDLDRQILKPLCSSGKIFCYDSPEYVKDMGTPERYMQVQNDFLSGRVHSRNLKHKQKAVFLDRDGTINKFVGFLRNIEEFELLPDVPEAIRRINSSGYLAIVVTNQPVIARGEVSVSELEEIHNKMETLLGQEGAYLDAIYYCPHHPHKGYEGEIPELKIECDCRKPKPGMLLRAADDFNIDLSQSWMIGDSDNDILAGKAAGCKTGLIGSDYDSLFDFVSREILS